MTYTLYTLYTKDKFVTVVNGVHFEFKYSQLFTGIGLSNYFQCEFGCTVSVS